MTYRTPQHECSCKLSARKLQLPGQSGFTLTELMVVIFIIGLLSTVVLINVLPSQDRAMIVKAKSDLATIEQGLEMYRIDNLVYPSTADGLGALIGSRSAGATPGRDGYLKRLPNDPWRRPYQYQSPAFDGSAFDVWSWGADGVPGGTGENADIRF